MGREDLGGCGRRKEYGQNKLNNFLNNIFKI